jgi:hypothetical protein
MISDFPLFIQLVSVVLLKDTHGAWITQCVVPHPIQICAGHSSRSRQPADSHTIISI